MWIIIKQVPPVAVPIQKLGIYWATPWDLEHFSISQMSRLRYRNETEEEFFDQEYFVNDLRGMEPNWKRSVKITIGDDDVRVFPHEFNKLTPEKMRLYILGDPVEGLPSHELVPNREADAALLRTALETDLRDIYDAAMVDGCNTAMAYCVALGIPIDDDAFEFPPYGWYRLRPEYAAYFGVE